MVLRHFRDQGKMSSPWPNCRSPAVVLPGELFHDEELCTHLLICRDEAHGAAEAFPGVSHENVFACVCLSFSPLLDEKELGHSSK